MKNNKFIKLIEQIDIIFYIFIKIICYFKDIYLCKKIKNLYKYNYIIRLELS